MKFSLKKTLNYFLCCAVLSSWILPNSIAQSVVYPAPQGMMASKEYSIKINGTSAFVYPSTVPAAYCSFDIKGSTTIAVKPSVVVESVVVRPLSLNIKPVIKNGIIHFTIDRPCKLSVEINGSLKMPLFLFANKAILDKPEKSDPNVIFFEAGKVYETNRITLKDNNIVYIESGAFVKGSFFLDSIKNVRIYGHGILDGSIFEKGKQRMIEINRCDNISVEGITITDSKHWTVPCNLSTNITYRDLKIISNNDWDDGIDVVSSKNVLIDDCFVRTKDDCIAVKAGTTYYTKFYNQSITSDVRVMNSVIWNAEWGNALEIGFETRADSIKNITFSNIDIIHAEGPEGTFTIHNGDRAIISNVLYENIRVEDSRGWLVDFKILKSRYSRDTSRGGIENIHFKNISVGGNNFPYSQLLGFNDTHPIKGVLFENFIIHGTKINGTYNGLIASLHCEELTFK